MQVFELQSQGVARNGDGVEVRSRLCNLPESISKCLKPLLSEFGVELVDTIEFRPEHATKSISIHDEDLHGKESITEAISREIRRQFEDVVRRHANAFAAEEPLVRGRWDGHFIRLNQLAWSAGKIGAQLWILPGTEYAWLVQATDPAILRCAEPLEDARDHIEIAEVLGVREILRCQQTLWDIEDQIEVVISLNHRLPEVKHRISRGAAQAMWQGRRYVNCDVTKVQGQLPVVVDGTLEVVDVDVHPELTHWGCGGRRATAAGQRPAS